METQQVPTNVSLFFVSYHVIFGGVLFPFSVSAECGYSSGLLVGFQVYYYFGDAVLIIPRTLPM